MSLLFSKDGFNTSTRNLGFKNMKRDIIYLIIVLSVSAIVWIYILSNAKYETHSLTLVGQYTVYNYTTSDGAVKIFLLSKDRLNQSVLLTNENDITEKILVTRIPY